MDRKMTVIASIMAVAALLVLWTVACAPEGPGSEDAPFTGCRLLVTAIEPAGFLSYGVVAGYTMMSGSTPVWVPPSGTGIPTANITFENVPYCNGCTKDNCTDVFLLEKNIEYNVISGPALSAHSNSMYARVPWDGEFTLEGAAAFTSVQEAQLTGPGIYEVVFTFTGVNSYDYEVEAEASLTLVAEP